jgi:hypothetical protein
MIVFVNNKHNSNDNMCGNLPYPPQEYMCHYTYKLADATLYERYYSSLFDIPIISNAAL